MASLFPYLRVQMISIIGSLLIVIFSFGLGIILTLLCFNMLLYLIFLKLGAKSKTLTFTNRFPRLISNKRNSLLSYEENEPRL